MDSKIFLCSWTSEITQSLKIRLISARERLERHLFSYFLPRYCLQERQKKPRSVKIFQTLDVFCGLSEIWGIS
jgi:hypothetical protein